MFINLLNETIEAIAEIGKSIADVKRIVRANAQEQCGWEQFTKIANFNYGNSIGGIVPSDLVIEMNDGGKLIRQDNYYGNNWAYQPVMPEVCNEMRAIFSQKEKESRTKVGVVRY